MNWIKRNFRLMRKRCPYCNKKLLDGHSGIMFHGIKVCPDRHYLEEVHPIGLKMIYDGDGEKLNIQI